MITSYNCKLWQQMQKNDIFGLGLFSNSCLSVTHVRGGQELILLSLFPSPISKWSTFFFIHFCPQLLGSLFGIQMLPDLQTEVIYGKESGWSVHSIILAFSFSWWREERRPDDHQIIALVPGNKTTHEACMKWGIKENTFKGHRKLIICTLIKIASNWGVFF